MPRTPLEVSRVPIVRIARVAASLPNDPVPGVLEKCGESCVPGRVVDDAAEPSTVWRKYGLERRIIDSDMARAHDHDPRDSSLGRVEGKDAPACVLLADGRPCPVDRADALAVGIATEERTGAGDREKVEELCCIRIDGTGVLSPV